MGRAASPCSFALLHVGAQPQLDELHRALEHGARAGGDSARCTSGGPQRTGEWTWTWARVPQLQRHARFRRVCFYGALAVIFFSLNGWLHDLSDYYLFSAHMVQHLLLTLLDAAAADHWSSRLDAAAAAAHRGARARSRAC